MELKGYLGFKGERGYSAYEIAVQQGFNGTINDWLASLGTASHFTESSTIYIATENQSEFALPDEYTENSFIDIYIEGRRFNSNQYTIDTITRKIILNTPIDVAGTIVEVVILTMATNNLPITETINESSTNETASGTKSVYDFVKPISDDVNTLKTNVDKMNTDLGNKVNKANIQVLTGSIQNIPSGETKTLDLTYPTGFTKSNTAIISKLVSSNNVYYDTNNVEATGSGFPEIDMIALTDEVIRVWMINSSTSTTRNGYCKLTLMKID